jgi:hypothetical protein
MRRRKQNTSHENESLVTNPRTSDQDLRSYKDNSPNGKNCSRHLTLHRNHVNLILVNKSSPHAAHTPYGANCSSLSPPPIYGFSQAPPQPPANVAYELAGREVSELHGETYRGKPSRLI